MTCCPILGGCNFYCGIGQVFTIQFETILEIDNPDRVNSGYGKEAIMTVATIRNAEGKFRTNSEVKKRATEIYSHWGLSLSDAINAFLVKSVEVGGLPFEMRPELPSYDQVAGFLHESGIG